VFSAAAAVGALGSVVTLPGEQGIRLFSFKSNSFTQIKALDMKTALLDTKGSSKCHGLSFNYKLG
jgi:hypothetical protein